nr:hypothetical protein [Tanacetum cinerariifolium]
MMSEKKVNTKPVDYAALNQLSKDFETRFVPQTELSAEQAFWSRYLVNSEEPNLSSSTTIVKVPKELPKVIMVNSSLKKLKFHLASFNVVVKERTTTTTITEGTWGFEHIKACFRDEIIPFVKALKDLLNSFDQYLIDELTEVQNGFNQMEQAVEQHYIEKNKFQDKMNDVLKENERLLEQAISVNIVNIVVHANVVQIVLLYLDSGCSKHMTGDRSQLINFVQKFLGTVKFGNDHVVKIMGYGDYKIRNLTILRASKTKSWLWHHRLLHLNFGTINHLARQGLVRGLFKLKFEKDHICSACAMGKSKKKSHKPKSKDTNQEKLYLLHMDLCGQMHVESDEAPDFIIKFLKMIQVRLKVPVRRIRIDNGTEFVNQTLREYYEEVGISHETSVAPSPQQNGVVERRNRPLIKAARTMLIYAQALLFL